jgi:GntR family transcriptional regulator
LTGPGQATWVLDPASPVPLYRQLADELASGIRAGEHAVGSQIPSEHQLSTRYCLGRPTVRQATDLLVRRGLLVRRRGSGTFVAAPRPEVDLFTLAGTLAAFARTGLTLRTRLLELPRLRRVPADPDNPFTGRHAYSFARLGQLDRVPVLVEHLFLDPAVFPALETLPLAHEPLSELVERRYSLRPVGGRQLLGAVTVPARWARRLGVTRSTPLLLVRRWLDFPGAPAALYARMYCRSDQVEVTQTLGPDRAFG